MKKVKLKVKSPTLENFQGVIDLIETDNCCIKNSCDVCAFRIKKEDGDFTCSIPILRYILKKCNGMKSTSIKSNCSTNPEYIIKEMEKFVIE